MTEVVKRNGKKEAFNKNKLANSIRKALIDGGYQVEKTGKDIETMASNIARETQKKTSVRSAEIKSAVKAELGKNYGKAVQAWDRFDEKYKM